MITFFMINESQFVFRQNSSKCYALNYLMEIINNNLEIKLLSAIYQLIYVNPLIQ